MKRYGEELNGEQIERLDEIDNAAYDFACIMTCLCHENGDENNNTKETLEWDMEYIGDIIDAVAEIMKERGYNIYYPFITQDKNGRSCTYDYLDEEE